MKKTLIILLILYGFTYSQNSNTVSPISSSNHIDYPLIELTGGVGLIWLLQFNATYSPLKHLYIQPRFSSSLISSEAGVTVGFQNRFNENSILRLGIGYSQGDVLSLDPGGDSSDDHWKSLYFRLGLLKRKNQRVIFNPNINITRFDRTPIFSFNFTVGYCLFK